MKHPPQGQDSNIFSTAGGMISGGYGRLRSWDLPGQSRRLRGDTSDESCLTGCSLLSVCHDVKSRALPHLPAALMV